MILVDTNLLLRLIQVGHGALPGCRDAINLLTARDNESFVMSHRIFTNYT